MRNALSKALADPTDMRSREDDASIDRILEAAFFRKRPLQAGTTANVIHLADRPKSVSQRASFLSARGGLRR